MKVPSLLSALPCAALVSSCSGQDPVENHIQMTAGEVREETRKAGATASLYLALYLARQREEYLQAIEVQLAEYESKRKEYNAKVELLEPDAGRKHRRLMKEFSMKIDLARKRLREFRSADIEAWGELKSGMNAVMEDLERSYKKAASPFAQPASPSSAKVPAHIRGKSLF